MKHPLPAPIERRLNKDTLLVPIERKLVPNLFRDGNDYIRQYATDCTN